ncbi:outer membrane protein assembly factor BamC [Pseudoduganella flava]|uniref:Outer membrane protein assembly factor BamC n=1 Tax=Pseudoduganella flava TaxID=871742 RepID=A0A562PT00_9BURK|nr:outer membrane protein assembly factor BamC [Pseudoduganella flava]QGZ39136.1 outer membrane protein assembly factor BamC [Pseudoduganella flava]TWI47577.1 outer membrane protein assembly factor BamC [Pseudoduganella flava]
MIKKASLLPLNGIALGVLLLSLSGCGMVESVVGKTTVDYKSAKKASTLDVPPDLTQLQKDNRYALPDSGGSGIATASGYAAQRAGMAGAGGAAAPAGAAVGNDVATTGNDKVRVERAGNQRWLVVKQSPDVLWPQLKSFWEESGFTLALDNATAGVMETEWNENRAKIPEDFIRRTIGKVFDSAYSTGERDKFRTRLERNADGTTEIFISHRGAEEIAQGPEKEIVQWTPRPSDPNLEAVFLAKLLTKLGGTEETAARTAVDNAIVQPLHAFLKGEGTNRYVETDEGFDRSWRRVGLALDRAGFTVEDRDRVQGIYFVRYVADQVEKKGFLSRLFSWGSSDADKEAQRYRIVVKAAPTGNTSQVTVQNNKGEADTSPTGTKILTLLQDELK